VMPNNIDPAHFAAACDADRNIRALALGIASKHGISPSEALAVVVASAMANLCMAGPKTSAALGQAMLDRIIDGVCNDKKHMGDSSEEIQHEGRLTRAWSDEATPRIARWK